MEWVYLVAAVLAIPVIAIVALVRAGTNARELRRLEELLRATQRDLRAVSAKLDTLAAAPRAAEPQPAPAAPVTASPVAETAAPQQPAAPEPPPTLADTTPPVVTDVFVAAASPAPTKAANLEESLTSRWFVWLGAIAVALAGTFLVKYTIDEGLLGPAARCVLGFLLGASLAAAGEWLRRRPLQKAIAAVRADYVPPALTASGLFIAFTSVYAAYALYSLMSPLVALLALAAIALAAVGLSLLHGFFVALMGVLGGFATPALVATNVPNPWGLFIYLLVIQAASLAVARFRGWWWLAFATLGGAVFWPVLWMSLSWSGGDEIPVGLYLILTALAFFFVRWGWESPPGSTNWLEEFQNLHKPERVVWIAGCAVALLAIGLVASADYNTVSLILFGVVAGLYLLAGRRDAVFDALPVVMALATLFVMGTMPLPMSVTLALDPHAPIVPVSLVAYVYAAIAFALLFGVAGFVVLWGAKRPAIWAGISAGVPVGLLAIAYSRITHLDVDLQWALVAFVLAGVSLFAAERVERHREARGLTDALGLYAAAVVAFLSLAATMSLREAWLTVALSLQLPMLALIHQRIAVRPIRVLAAIVAGVVLVRLVLNYEILSYAVSANPLFSWVIYGYGLPALSFFFAGRIFRRASAPPLLTMLLDAGALAFGTLLVSLEIRILVTGSLAGSMYLLFEQSLQAISWLSIGTVLALNHLRQPNPVAYFGARALLSLASAQILLLHLLAGNPIFTHVFVGFWPLIDVLLLAYAVPAAFAFGLSVIFDRGGEALLARIAAIAGFVLLFAYITLEVRHIFQGPVLQEMNQSDAESYAYSVVWLLFAMALLGLGIVFRQAMLRYASLAILVVVVFKVFLLDMSDLAGLYRVGSFLGLGLTLVGIGFIYQRFVFPRPR